METKKCNKCGRDIPFSGFSKNRSLKDGLQIHCKECQSRKKKVGGGGQS